MILRPLSTLMLLVPVTCLSACSGDGDKEQPPAGTAAPATGSPAGAAAGSPAAPSGKTVHVKRTQGECTFDFDAPEPLKESAKDGMSFTLESDSFSFVGYEGTTLHSKPENALDMFKDKYRDVYRGTENGVQVAIVTALQNDKPATDKHVISGMGGEPYASGRSLGCTFICDGVKDREADVVAMCKSVRITVTPEKTPE